MLRDNSVYLQHILDSIERIESYMDGYDFDLFLKDYLVQDGVIRQLEIIGEATKQLLPELQNKHDHIPWQDIAGMRDVLIHHYFGVDIEKVWLTTQEDIPPLKTEVVKILDELKDK